MLADSFYILKSSSNTGNAIEAVIQLQADHDIFNGHFPGNPVTPGVVQMEIIKELLEKELGIRLILKTMSNAKFLAVLNPLETPEIRVAISFSTEDSLSYKVSASIIAEEKIFFKLQGNYLVM